MIKKRQITLKKGVYTYSLTGSSGGFNEGKLTSKKKHCKALGKKHINNAEYKHSLTVLNTLK